jgi:hypothetical protein
MSAPPRRDKFAALAQQQQQLKQTPNPEKHSAVHESQPQEQKRDKFAAMAAASSSSALEPAPPQQEQDPKAEALKLLQERIDQRSQVWKDLEEAEAAAVKLLDVAQETTARLAERTLMPDKAKEYNQLLSSLHSKLAPHATLIRAYEQPTRSNRMYLTRIEQRLADQKRLLLQDIMRIETESSLEANAGAGKRKRDEN